MKKLRNIIIVTFIVIIILIIALILLLNRNSKQLSSNNNTINNTVEEHLDIIRYRKYNEIPRTYISDQQMCNIYLNDYKNNALYRVEEAYNTMDKEYREKRFGTLEDYKAYVEKNINTIFNIKMAKYSIQKR